MTTADGLPKPPVPSRSLPLWVLNLVAFQAGWWALVLTAAQGRSELGLGVVALILAWHLGRIRPLTTEALLISLAVLVGFCFDSLLLASGWVSFSSGGLGGDWGLGTGASPGGTWGPVLPPLWLMALWANFAITLNISLVSLQTRPWLAAGLGLVGGPAAYWGGAQLGAMTFLDPSAGLLALALGWAILTPVLLTLARVLNGRRIAP